MRVSMEAELPQDEGEWSLLKNVHFSEEEKEQFLSYTHFMTPNQKVMERIAHTYILMRLLMPPRELKSSLPGKVMPWIILCEIWPMQMTKTIGVIDHLSSVHNGVKYSDTVSMRLNIFFEKYVESFFDDMSKVEKLSPAMQANYVEVKSAENDPKMFCDMLSVCDINVGDVGTLHGFRDSRKLRSYTVNIEPTISPLICDLIYHFLEAQTLTSSIEMAVESREMGYSKKQTEKEGIHVIPFSTYALSLAQLIVLKVPAPYIIGLFAVPGTCKEDIMGSVIANVRAIVISQAIQETYRHNEVVASDLQNLVLEMVKDKESKWHHLYKWLKLGGHPAMTTNDGQINEHLVDVAWKCRLAPYAWEKDLISFITWPIRTLFHCSLCPVLRLCYAKAFPVNRQLQQIHQAWMNTGDLHLRKKHSKDAIQFTDYEFIWFNAWLYSGTDNLWAAFIKSLNEGVEKHYGPDYAHAEKRAAFIRTVLSVVFSVIVLYYGIRLITLAEIFGINERGLGTVMAGVIAGFASIGGGGYSLFSFVKKSTPKSEEISADPDKFSSKMGYMNEVKTELKSLASFIRNPKRVNFWNYLIPSLLESNPIKDFFFSIYFNEKISSCLQNVLDHSKPLTPCKFIILVNDLDRCPPSKVAEIIKAVVLLTEDTPFVVFLAGNSEDLSSAIEVENGKFYTNSGRSGYSYLDKIMHLPFVVPQINEDEKESIFRQILKGEAAWQKF